MNQIKESSDCISGSQDDYVLPKCCPNKGLLRITMKKYVQ